MKYWYGDDATILPVNGILVFGSNPEGRHGLGLAKIAVDSFGAVYGRGRGLYGRSYALVTKNLRAGYVEHTGSNGSQLYKTAGGRSVSELRIVENLTELFNCARFNEDKVFHIPYIRGSKNLNGYTSGEIVGLLLLTVDIPDNIIIHQSFRSEVRKHRQLCRKVEHLNNQ